MISPHQAVTAGWLAVAGVWLWARMRTPAPGTRAGQGEPRLRRLGRLAALSAVFTLLLADGWTGPLATRFLPEEPWAAWLGVTVAGLGVAFASWARWVLAGSWSDQVAVSAGQELVRSGPYRWLPHPIYAGLLTAALGTALAEGEIRGVVGVAVLGVVYFRKARAEDRLLEARFGQAWIAWRNS